MTTATSKVPALPRHAVPDLPPRTTANRAAIARRLMLCQVAGYVILIAISWLNELLDLPSLVFGGTPGQNWHEAIIETILILGAALPTLLLTGRMARRLVYLENFLRVCAWCRKIGVEDRWVSMETYFNKQLNTKTSHGMCPECFASLRSEIERSTSSIGQ